MPIAIFYFSGTGNSLMVARSIAEELGDTRLISVNRAKEDSINTETDTIGLVFPVYWGGLPLCVRELVPLLNRYSADYIFAVATHAGGPGRVLSQLRNELLQQGMELSSGICLQMPSNYIISYDAPSKDEIDAELRQADRIISEIAESVRRRVVCRDSSDLPRYEKQTAAYEKFIARVNCLDDNYKVDSSCTECGDCARVCPARNIELIDGRPSWLHNCEMCLACINWCPESAIQYGPGTSRRGRYTNPRTSLEDLAFERL